MGKNDQRGNIALSMASAPLAGAKAAGGDGTVEGGPRENRFARIFSAVTFEAKPIKKPYVFRENEGTPSQREVSQYELAQVHLELADLPGVYFETARIVKRVPTDGSGNAVPGGEVSIKLTMPTVSLGKGVVRIPIISVTEADERTQKEYLAFQEGILFAFKTWRKGLKSSGYVDKTTSTVGQSQQVLSKSEIEELGL